MHLLPEFIFRGENIATIPNLLTWTRFVVSGYVAYLLATDGPSITAGWYYAAGAITDFFDGKIARSFPWQATNFGKRLDPISDSFAFHTPLWALGITASNWVDAAIFIWSSSLLAIRDGILFKKWLELERIGEIFEVTKIGKLKTAINMVAISIIVATPGWHHFAANPSEFSNMATYLKQLGESSLLSIGFNESKDIQALGKWLLGMWTAASLGTLVDYWGKIEMRLKARRKKSL